MTTSTLSIGSYFRFLNRAGAAITNRAYQNFFISESRTWESVNYVFAPVAFDGNLVSNALANSRATLVAPANLITQAVCAEAARERWLLEIKYVVLTPTENAASAPSWTETSTLATDLWVCSGYTRPMSNGGVLQLELTSPLDAVEARTPNCILQDWQVGSLPVTGSLLLE